MWLDNDYVNLNFQMSAISQIDVSDKDVVKWNTTGHIQTHSTLMFFRPPLFNINTKKPNIVVWMSKLSDIFVCLTDRYPRMSNL